MAGRGGIQVSVNWKSVSKSVEDIEKEFGRKIAMRIIKKSLKEVMEPVFADVKASTRAEAFNTGQLFKGTKLFVQKPTAAEKRRMNLPKKGQFYSARAGYKVKDWRRAIFTEWREHILRDAWDRHDQAIARNFMQDYTNALSKFAKKERRKDAGVRAK